MDTLARGPKRVRITLRDLKRYGVTPGFPGCANVEHENWSDTGAHNQECRARMYKHFQQDGNGKWTRASVDLQGMQKQVHRQGPEDGFGDLHRARIPGLPHQMILQK